LEHARVLTDLGEALHREGRRVEAREPLRQAFKLARQCGAARVAKRANAELQATGLSVRRYTPIGVESLTPSERRVADLAASGMTNRQIAQSLFVTVKTVEAHLSAAYGKLDISSRRELEGALESDSSEEPGSA
jgi:DNA-binding NarL/FixJ family response regulator